MTRHRHLLLLILLTAAALRLVGIARVSPPGLAHDEVAHWLINRSILAGDHAIYFTEAYGHEAGFHYVQAAFQALLGDHALALRLPAAFAGLLGVAVTYALARLLFGQRVALLAAVWLAVLFYPVFYSRLALRAISLPLCSGLSAYFWWRGWRRPAATAAFYFLAAGLFAGLSLHTYMAGRAVPVFYLLFTGYLALFHRPRLRAHGRGVALFFIAFALVAAPLLTYLLTHPGAEHRISEIDAPLQALKAGDWRPVISNSLKLLGMFGWQGDRLWRQNAAGQPIFEPVTGLFFYAGLLLSLFRWRDSRHLFLILWLLTAAIPSMVTIDAPSNIRIINSLPLLTLFPALTTHSFGHLSTVLAHLSTENGRKVSQWLAAILILLAIDWTAVAIFRVWPVNNEVEFVWQRALSDAAAYLDDSPAAGPVAVAGWTPDTMDPPAMELALRRTDLSRRYFDPTQSLIVPAAAAGQSARIVRPAILPLAPYLEEQLAGWGVVSQTHPTFVGYELGQAPAVLPDQPANLTFGGELTFLGHDLPAPCASPAADPCLLVTYWRVARPAGGPRRFFLHLVDPTGAPLAQDDRLAVPAEHWQPGDLVIQLFYLPLPAEGAVRLGVYDPVTGQRLPAAQSQDFALLSLAP